MLGGSLVLGAVFVWLNSGLLRALTSTQTQIAGDALMHSQRVGKATPNAIQGNKEAFKQLADSRKEFNNDLNVLSKGGVYQGREISVRLTQKWKKVPCRKFRKSWVGSDKAAATIMQTGKRR